MGSFAEAEPVALPRSYAARLFWVQYNVILLAGALLFSLASASVVPAAVGLGLELVLLLVGPQLPSLRRWLDAREVEPAGPGSVPPSVPPGESLEPAYASRVAGVERALDALGELARQQHPEAPAIRARLDTLFAMFARLAATHQRLATYLAATPEAGLSEEIERLKQAFSAEKDLGLRLALRQSMALVQRRIEQRGQTAAALRTLGVQLETAERSVADLTTQGRTLGISRGWVAELDAIVGELGTELEGLDSSALEGVAGLR